MEISKYHKTIAALCCAACMVSTPALAETGTSDNWNSSGTIYLWGSGIQSDLRNGGDIDISFGDILDDLAFAFMGTLVTRKDKWGFGGDFIYLNAKIDNSANIPLSAVPGATVDLKAKSDITSWVINLLAGYNMISTEQATLDAIFGTRYFSLDSDLTLKVNSLSGRTLNDSQAVWDGVIGLRGELNLNKKWYLPYYADIGTGQSDNTWQLMGGVGYRYNWGELKLVYRHIEWDLGSDGLIETINISGPAFGATWNF